MSEREQNAADAQVLAASRQRTRRSFLLAGAGAAAGYGFYRWLDRERTDEMLPKLLRRSLQANASVSRGVFDEAALAPTYPLHRAETLRTNGVYGLKQELVPASYRLQLVGAANAAQQAQFVPDVTAWEYRYAGKSSGDQGHDTKVDLTLASSTKMSPAPSAGAVQQHEQAQQPPADSMPKIDKDTGRPARGSEEAGQSFSTLNAGTPGLLLTLEDVLKLPRHELVTQFKCIEGWSQIVHWAGVRMADFLEAYPPQKIEGREPRYVYMETPDGDYYTGYDMHVCRHPQTLLVTEMMGAPLTQLHGAPLRLHMPTKYGYKQIKRIGLIAYTDARPDDYWTELGYDWYAGL